MVSRANTLRAGTSSVVFVVAVSLNAFLLFLLEPMFGKMALPHLGGTAAVWTTCLLFFQAALVGGYIYSHALASLRNRRLQVAIHAALALAVGLSLPVSIPSDWTPGSIEHPEVSLLILLALRVGGP